MEDVIGLVVQAAVVGGLFWLTARLLRDVQEGKGPRGGDSSEPGGFYSSSGGHADL